jgi:hypothetical protein
MHRSTCLAAILLTAATSAHAEVGVQVQVLPFVDSSVSDDDSSASAELGPAFALAAQLGMRVTPNVSVAFAPRLTFGMSSEDTIGDGDEWRQLDLAVRLTGHLPIAGGKAEAFGYLAPAYSVIFLPEPEYREITVDDASGLALGLGLGAAMEVTPTLLLVGDVGYSRGFQESELHHDGESYDTSIQTHVVHVGLGIRGAM